MSKVKLIVTKPFRYGTRAYEVGDDLHVSVSEARLLKALKKAREDRSREPADIPPPPPELAVKISALAPSGAADDLAQLRREYSEALGKRPFPGWDAATLREKIAQARAA